MDDDDVPPLEDMEAVVEKVRQLNVAKGKTASRPSPDERPLPDRRTKTPPQAKDAGGEPNSSEAPESRKPSTFGGMNKGFLLGGGAKPKAKRKPQPEVDYVVTAPKSAPERTLVLSDVQRAMGEKSDSKWLNDDLLKSVESNETLLKRLTEPRFAEAVELMKKDPRAAMERYKGDAEVQDFFKQFYKLLGNHFADLASSSSDGAADAVRTTPAGAGAEIVSEDEARMNRILADPEVREILAKPDVQNLFAVLRSDPEQAQTMLRTCSGRMKADVHKLVSCGLLGFESS